MKSDHPNTQDLLASPTDEQANILDSVQSPEALRFGGYATTASLAMLYTDG